MSVHRGSQQFKIFADGNADTRRIESLVNSSIEMILRAGSHQVSDTNDEGKAAIGGLLSTCRSALQL
jgi:hypothetical protein